MCLFWCSRFKKKNVLNSDTWQRAVVLSTFNIVEKKHTDAQLHNLFLHLQPVKKKKSFFAHQQPLRSRFLALLQHQALTLLLKNKGPLFFFCSFLYLTRSSCCPYKARTKWQHLLEALIFLCGAGTGWGGTLKVET